MGASFYNSYFVILVFSFFLTSNLHSQNDSDVPVYPNRYRLNLPEEWIKKPRLVNAVTNILPQTISELNDKDFCTACKAGYNVTLLIDSVEIYNEQTSAPIQIGYYSRYTYSFDYSFYAALLVTDSAGRPLSMLRLNDVTETLSYTRELRVGQQNAVYRYEYIYNSTGTRVIGRRLVEEAPSVITDIPKIDAASILTTAFLRNICENSIYEIEKLLRKLK